MDLIERIAQIIVPVFLIVLIGYVYARRHTPDLGTLNPIMLDLLAPMLVYAALAGRDFRLGAHIELLAGGALLMLGCGVVAWMLARLSGTQPRTLVPVVMFNNSGNMGLPLALLAFGAEHFGAAVALFAISNLMHCAIGLRITSRHARTRDLLRSPLMIGTLLGFASAATGIRPPDMVLAGFKLLGDAALPLMLFSLGVRLTALRRASIPLGLMGAVARPLIGLALALPLAWALNLQGAARGQLILFAALPPAVMQYLFAERYGQEPEKVAAMILLGNALALVSVPLAIALTL